MAPDEVEGCEGEPETGGVGKRACLQSPTKVHFSGQRADTDASSNDANPNECAQNDHIASQEAILLDKESVAA